MRRVYLGAMVGALVSLGLAQPALAADRVEPLNQYIVKGTDAELDQLGALGYDVTEGADAPGRSGIVATPSQADALEAKGFDVSSLGKENTQSAAPAAAGIPLADPTWGYDVYRPWNLKPAPCQTVCSGAVDADGNPVSIKQWMDAQAAANPTLVKRVVYGTSVNGQELVAYKVTQNATTTADGSRPAAMFHGAQHAREWISVEVTRREFKYVLDHRGDADMSALLAGTELWFIPVFNVDGYDYTFQSRATRLWRKNLRDTNNNGTIASGDGIDTNRNFSEKWRYDNEGASDSTSSETYRGPAPESEPEVKSFHDLMKVIKPKFHIDYHSYAQLVLYPVGWQVETYGGDTPLMEALAGDDQRPAVAGYDPDVGGELYTTNGEITDTMYLQEGVLAYTVELDGGSGSGVGGTTSTGNTVGMNPGGFVFQDREADVEAVAAKNIPFMLDLAQSATHPDTPVSHLGNAIPDFVPQTFGTSYGSPQTVEVNAKRALGDVTVNYQINGGATQTASTSEFNGGKRYGRSGVYYHRMRGEISGFKAGDSVKVWFTAGGQVLERLHLRGFRQRPRQPGPGAFRRGLHRPLAEHGADRRPVISLDLHGCAGRRRDPGRRLRHRRQQPHHGRRAGRARPLSRGHLVHGHRRLRPRSRPDRRHLEDVRRPDDRHPRLPQRRAARSSPPVSAPCRAPGRSTRTTRSGASRTSPSAGRTPTRTPARARSASSRTACRRPTTSCSTGWGRTRAPTRRRRRPR